MKIKSVILLLAGLFVHWNVMHGQISLTKRDETCEGKKDGWIQVNLENISGVPTYSWTKNGQPFTGGKVVSGLAPGDYTVTVTVTGGCTATKSAKIWDGKDVHVDISAHLLSITPHPIPCGIRPVFSYELTAIPTGGTAPYYCSWGEGGGQNGECTKLASGQFIDEVAVIIDDNGCVGSAGFKKIAVKKYCPKDPNDISGPEGFGDEQWMSVHDDLDYNVRFENDPLFATANAATVFVMVPIDDDIDPFSFRLGTFGFGNKIIEVPDNASFFQERIDYSADLGFWLDVTAGLDLPNNRFFWVMQTIDPLTGQPPADPMAGFLPVNDSLTGSGEGFVNFTCAPKTSTLTGELVNHQASIIFDLNDPIQTNTWSNTIDAFAPSSIVQPIPDTVYSNHVPFEWTISDDSGGCGVLNAEILLSTDNTLFTTGALLPTGDSTSILLEWGTKYYYRVRGTDYVHNMENAMVDSFVIVPQRRIEFLSPDRNIYCLGDSLQIDLVLTTVEEADLYLSRDSGMTYVILDSNVTAWPYILVLDSTMLDSSLFLKAVSNEFVLEELSIPFTVKPLPQVNAIDDVTGCDNEILFVDAIGANTYAWWPEIILGTPHSPYSNIYTDSSQYVYVRGTDVFGCSGLDSVFLFIHTASIDTLSTPLCEGDSLFINNEWIVAEGFYPTTYSSFYNCDSVMVSEVYFQSPCLWSHGPYVYVDMDATGANDGSSWEDAFNELTDAIYVAGRYENVQEIWVAEGLYSPHASRRDTSFILRDSIKIFGGFLGIESTREERTSNAELVFLSGDINVPDTLWDNSYHTLQINESCVECTIDGVTIQYGYADQPGNTQDIGAGVLCKGKAHFSNVIFERNYATDLGAALHSSGTGSSLVIEGCTFRLNTSSLGKDLVNLSGAQIEFRGANSIH